MPVSPSSSPLSLLAPLFLLSLGLGMGALWLRWRPRKELGWMGLSFACSSMGMLVQVLHMPQALLANILAFTLCYTAGVCAAAHALALRLGVGMPWRAALLVLLPSFVLQLWFSAVDPQLELRVYVLNLGTMAILGLPLLYWRSMALRSVFDQLLRWAYVLTIVLNLLRMLWLMPLSSGVAVEAFSRTWFWVGIHFSAMFFGLLMACALVMSVVWEVIQTLQQERDLDPLTQLLNRRAFQEKVRALELTPDAPQRWMLLLCDLDHFKWVNDTWGHAAGDGVLQVAAQLLQRNVRATDMVARMGGEEFAVLMAGGDMTTAMQVAERIRREMSQTRLPMLVGERVTMSIGVTLVKSLEPQTLEDAMAQADRLLFSAKRAGRNRVRGDLPAALQPATGWA